MNDDEQNGALKIGRDMLNIMRETKDASTAGLLGIYFETWLMHDTVIQIARRLEVTPRKDADLLLGEFRKLVLNSLIAVPPEEEPPEPYPPRP